MGLLVSVVTGALMLMVFRADPPPDLTIARALDAWARHGAADAPAFAWGRLPGMEALVGASRLFAQLAFGACVVWLMRACRRRPRRPWERLRALVLVVSLVVGPGIVVNNVLKDHWGRARPRELVEFGGTRRYTPPWTIASECRRNCSFVSGHVAGGFAPVALWFVMPSPWWPLLGLATGLLLTAFRLASGAHFLSDALFAGWVDWTVAALVTLAFTSRWRRGAAGRGDGGTPPARPAGPAAGIV